MTDFVHDVTHHTFVHENFRAAVDAYHYDAHPMGLLVSAVGGARRPSTRLARHRERARRIADRIRLIAKMPTIAASRTSTRIGQPFIYPDNDLGYAANFLNMMFEIGEPYEVDPASRRRWTCC